MFITLLIANFLISLLTCYVVVRIFRTPISSILQRLVAEDIYAAWSKYLTFAIYVVGISGGVRVWDLEKYITPKGEGGEVLQLTSERWVLEVYRTVIGTLQSAAWMLLLFFLFALIAYVIVKGLEAKKQKRG
ncbi:MAG: hypothetical protein WEB62_01730 [Bacteroidota bacterium]